MKFYLNPGSFAVVSALMAFTLPTASHALTMQECSAKYEAAKTAGSLGERKWNDFRKAECSSDVSPVVTAPPAAIPAATQAPKTAEAKPAEPPVSPVSQEAAKPAVLPAISSGPMVFPAAIAAKYASDTPGKGRMRTCVDQYKINKVSNGNGGMKWIEKGGGYYSQCNARLKGSAAI